MPLAGSTPCRTPRLHTRFPQAASTAAAAAFATSAQLRQWVDTAADATYVLLHSRVEARAGR